jgi:hypothetical protein
MSKQVGSASTGGPVAGAAAGASGLSTSAAAGAGSEDVVPFVSQVPGTPVSFPSFHGRPVSWFSVTLIMVAFLTGGIALVIGHLWWLFWAALVVCGIGGLIALATGITDDWY